MSSSDSESSRIPIVESDRITAPSDGIDEILSDFGGFRRNSDRNLTDRIDSPGICMGLFVT